MNQKHVQIAPFVISPGPRPVSGIQKIIFFFLFLLIPAGLLSAGWFLFSLTPVVPFSSSHIEIERFSGPVEVYAHAKEQWRLLTRRSRKGIDIKFQDKVRTAKAADIDFEIPGVFRCRLKEDSELAIQRDESGRTALKLERGLLLGETAGDGKGKKLQVETNQFILRFHEAAFRVRAVDAEHASLDVLEGTVDVVTSDASKTISVGPFQHVAAAQGALDSTRLEAINIGDWKTLNEIRDIKVASLPEEKEQVSLRKAAGGFFRYVSDEGAFYTPNFGFAKRRFYRNEKTNSVALRIDYDVFPQGSYSGIYFKTRGLDLSQFRRFSFRLKGDLKKPVPDEMRIEFKSRRAVFAAFPARPKPEGEGAYAFELEAEKPTPLSEVVFVFEHQKVGPSRLNGAVLIEDLVLE